MNNIKETKITSGLYLVSTPIGNLRDISIRALDTLRAVDLIVCEDTRVTGKLLHAYEIKNQKMRSYNDHNADKQRGAILETLTSGGCVALVSDAGTPLISDPGYKLIRDCQELGINVTSVPGANAPLTALQLSGLPTDRFAFIGFLPTKSAARKKLLQEWMTIQGSLVAFETGPRLLGSLKDMKDVLGDRDAAVIRELTKMHEEVRHLPLSELIASYEDNPAPKGEIVVVIGASEEEELSDDDLSEMLKKALDKLSVKDAAAFVAESTGEPRKKLYEMALSLAGK